MLVIMSRPSWNAYVTKDSTNGIKHINALEMHKPLSGVRKHGGSDMDKHTPCGNQATHFID